LDIASGGHIPTCAIVVLDLGAFTATPAIRVVRGGEGRRSYSLSSASADRDPAHHCPTPFQRRGCGLPADVVGPGGAFTGSCRPLTFPSSPAGTPESESDRPMCCPIITTTSRRHDVELTYESRTLLRPAGESKTGQARERLPSSREPASSSPAGRAQENV